MIGITIVIDSVFSEHNIKHTRKSIALKSTQWQMSFDLFFLMLKITDLASYLTSINSSFSPIALFFKGNTSCIHFLGILLVTFGASHFPLSSMISI